MLRFLGGLVLVLALVAGIALWAGWLKVGVVKQDNRTDIQVNVNTDKFKEDLTSFKERFGSKDSRQIRGKLLSVDTQQAAIEHGGETTTVQLTTATRVRLPGGRDGAVGDLRPGAEVMVDYVTRDNRHEAVVLEVAAP